MVYNSLYHKLVEITADYLGPAADRFVDRLISAHLYKDPEDLKPSDLPKITQWLKVSLGLLTNDRNLIDEYEERVLDLSKSLKTLSNGDKV